MRYPACGFDLQRCLLRLEILMPVLSLLRRKTCLVGTIHIWTDVSEWLMGVRMAFHLESKGELPLPAKPTQTNRCFD